MFVNLFLGIGQEVILLDTLIFSVRLEGTLSQYRKLDLSNEEKDEKIRDLEARFGVDVLFINIV